MTHTLRSAPVRPEPWWLQFDAAAELLRPGTIKPARPRRVAAPEPPAPPDQEGPPEPPVRMSVSSIVGAVVSILRKAWL